MFENSTSWDQFVATASGRSCLAAGVERLPHPAAGYLRHLRDEDIRSRGSAVSIDEAHRRGALHRGVWLAVLRGSAVDQLARSPPRTSVANGTAATAVRGGALKEHEGSQAKRAGSAEVLLLRRGMVIRCAGSCMLKLVLTSTR